VRDTRVYRGADHFHVIAKLAMPRRWRLNTVQKQEKGETFKIQVFKEERIMNLYRKRLNRYLNQRPIRNNINLEWNDFKGAII
jgi:hypothetical protein